MTAVRSGVEHCIFRASLNATIKRGLQCFVARVIMIKRQIVTEQHETVIGMPDMAKQFRQSIDIFAMNFD